MTDIDLNKALIRRYYEEMWNRWDLSLAEELLSPTLRFRGSLGTVAEGIRGFCRYARAVWLGFPDFHKAWPDHLTDPAIGGNLVTQTPTGGVWVMMMVPLARRNLLAEKGRFAISVAGVGFAVLLILTVLSLYRGWSRSGETFEQLPGQLWVTQHGTTDPFHSISLIPADDLAALQPIQGVQAVVPVLSRQMTVHVDGSDTPVRLMALGIPEGYAVSDEIRAKYLPARGEMIIDKTLSRQSGLQEGDSAGFGEVSLAVADVGPRSAEVLTPFGFVNFADAEEIFGVGDIVTYGMVVAEPNASIDNIGDEITATNAGLQVYTSSEFAKSIRKEIDESFIPIIVILVAIGFVVGAAVVGLTIYTATIERSREFGVMKAVGGSPGFLYRIVLSQSAILTTLGFAAGLAGAYIVTRLAERAVPEFATLFLARDIGLVFVASMVMAVIASFLPVRRINSIDPAVVFRA